MIVEKNLVIFVLVLHFRCAFCNDNVSTSQKTTVVMATKVDYNSRSTASPRSGISYDRKFMEIFTSFDPVSTENIMSVVKHNNAESMKNITNFMTYDSESTKNLNSLMNYETAIMNPYELIVENELLTDGIQSEADMNWISSPVTDNSTDTAWSKSIPDTVTTNAISTSSSDDVTDTWEVIDLKINDVNTEWITLSWESPCMNATNISIIYSIERCDSEKNCNKTDEYDTWHNATDLDACTQYTFIVKVITEVWESAGIELSATTADNISEIDDVLYLNVRDIDVNSVRLIWQEPLKHARCISNYLIIQCDVISKLCNETVVLTANHSATNLEPCTKYYFTVKTITSVVQSPGVNVTARTASPKLSKPLSVKITPGNFSLTVKWHPPEFGSVCLKYYRITIDSIKYSFNTTKTNVIISDLHACTSYSVDVIAVNKDNDDGAAVSKTSTTCRTRTNPPVLHKNALVTVNSISIIWSIEKENNPCTLTSIITTCNYTASNGTGYEFINGISVTEIEPDIAAAPVVVMNTTVTKLSPFASYTCWAYTVNIGGFSELSNGVNAKTMEDAPSPPTFHVVNITDSQFSLTWDLPEYLAGNLEDFEIALVWESLLPIPEWCPRKAPNNDNITKLNGSTLHYDYLKAKAYTNYTVMMRAKTGAGWGAYSISQTFQSNRRVPEAVSKFSYTIKENSNNADILDTILTWGLPCSLNGELETFNISVYGTRDGYIPHFFSIMNECTDYIYNDHMCSINLKELKGEYNYTFAISTKVKHVDNFGPTASQDGILYPAGIPSQPDEEYMNLITIDPYKMIRSTTKVNILLPLFPDTNGDIKYYAIMVSEIGYNKPSNRRFDVKSKIWPNTSSWEEAMISDFSITYQATRPKWDPYPNYIADYGHMKAVKYTIGEDTTCKEISSNTNKRLYCNGPLKPNTWYHVRMRAFTYGGYTDSEIIVIRTNAELNVAIVIGIVFGILFLGLLTTMMLLVRKCSPYVVLRRFLHSDMPGSPVPAPFTRKKFIAHCQQLIDNPGKLSNEFRLLQTLSVDLQMPTNAACLQANRRKNRYFDILPYDFSRVKLDVIDNDPNTDYINASFIRGYTGEDEYIACQGPKEETTYDFWRMVDQCNINIIIMLTELIEKGKEKCHQYYPTIRETFRYENMTIRCTSELDFRTHTQRTLVLQKENKKRNIIHLHFKDWPDYDVPEDFDAMINFCQIMRRNINANKGFVVVHCSAGIGRTGTLIAIDIILQHLRDNRKIDVFGTVYRLRHHRINMVQRDTQYAYIYNCIKQVLKNPYFLKTYKPPPVDPVYENISKNAKDPGTSNTNLVNNLRSQMSLQLYPRCDVPETNI